MCVWVWVGAHSNFPGVPVCACALMTSQKGRRHMVGTYIRIVIFRDFLRIFRGFRVVATYIRILSFHDFLCILDGFRVLNGFGQERCERI